jgi:hypothetical protein
MYDFYNKYIFLIENKLWQRVHFKRLIQANYCLLKVGKEVSSNRLFILSILLFEN